MQQKEFETLTGVKVSAEDYADIEKVYMAISMDKEEFCVAWRAGKLCYIVDELMKRIDALEHVRDREMAHVSKAGARADAAALWMLEKADEYDDAELKQAAIDLVGLHQVAITDVKNGFALSDIERDYIMANLR